MLIAVAPVDATLREQVLELTLDSAQRAWVGPIDVMLADADARSTVEMMAILADGVVVGCYRFEYRLRVVTLRAFDRPGVGLLGYCIDSAWQRRGVGTRALASVCDDLRQRHTDLALLVLNVACRNHAAIRVYRRAGFENCGPTHAGGAGGPEQLMLHTLVPAPLANKALRRS
ncbi:MAG: GNAT family N-acetyltransferase [Rhodanobacteraceae bacterium]